MIKLLALDMDGTLLNSQKEISEENIKAIHQAIEKGVKLVLCTGRPLVGVKPYYEQLHLKAEDEYVIVDNGCATHQTKDWRLVNYHALSKEDVLYLNQIADESPAVLTVFDEKDYLVIEKPSNDLIAEDAALVFTKPTEISLKEALNDKDILFQAMFLAQPEELDQFEKQFGSELSQRFSCVRSQDCIYETMPKGITKATALKELAAKLGIQPNEMMALGDANNDIEMLEFAGLGIAMGNASQHIQDLANETTATNDEHGVAKAIQHFILS